MNLSINFTKKSFLPSFRRACIQSCIMNKKITILSKRFKSSSAQINIKQNDIQNHTEDSKKTTFKRQLKYGPKFSEFFQDESLNNVEVPTNQENIPYLNQNISYGQKRKVYFEVYGCQMNVNDTEIVWSILKENNYIRTETFDDADIVLIITCAIRDSAEERIWGRLSYIRGLKRKHGKSSLKIGILGCMAERLKQKVLEKERIVDVVAGPDSYRDLPRLLALTENNQKSVNVLLSMDETYADITPVRLNEDSISAYVSIMRGCDNMCTYCIVPFTRGRERSRPVSSILKEVENLSGNGVKEITLLGQNVNSYRDTSENKTISNITSLAKGFKTVYKPKHGGLRFADLLHKVSEINPEIRIRFTSPHPKDFPDEVIDVIQSKANICKNLHMPAQSGNTAVLERMRRGYSREAYLDLISHIRKSIPNVALSTDMICGFCGETDEEFNDTITLMEEVKYNTAFLFSYSMREKTTAHRRFKDDVPKHVKIERLQKMVEVFRRNALRLNTSQIGKTHLVLIESLSKRSAAYFQSRNDQNIRVLLPSYIKVPYKNGCDSRLLKPGDYVAIYINTASSQTLKGIPLYITELQEYHKQIDNNLNNV